MIDVIYSMYTHILVAKESVHGASCVLYDSSVGNVSIMNNGGV